MNLGVVTQCIPQYRILSEDQVKEIHRASLEILETIGIRVLHEEAVQLLSDAGCRVKQKNIVLIPNWLVEECIQTAPSRITIYNRLGKEAMRLEGRNSYYGLGTDLKRTCDLLTNESRPSTLQDVANAAKVGDYCDELSFIASYALPNDVSTNMMYIECVRVMMQNSTKPIFFTAASRDDLLHIFKMAGLVAGGEQALREKPFLIQYSEPLAPLTHSRSAIEKLLLCAERGIPICYTPGDILGATSPISLAGGIAQANAEALSGIVLHQLKCKGAPIISGFAVVPIDMRTAAFSYGAPEFRLTNSAFADLYRHYNIPVWSTIGSDSNCLDQQAAMEHAFGILMAALDGANLIHDIGYLGQGLLGNPAAIIMGNEMISYVRRILRGFDISRETMGIDIIREIRPGGNYLTADHTLKFLRKELWQPKYISRINFEIWESNGKKSYGEVLTKKALDILRTHEPEPLPDDISHEIVELTKEAERALKGIQYNA